MISVNKRLTTKHLHPSANVENSWRMKDEEEHHTANTKKNNNDRQSYENSSSSECRRWNRVKVRQFTLTDDILTILHHPACLPESEMPCSPAFLGISKPMGLDENHHHDYGKADGEDSPQDSYGFRILHIICMLETGLWSVLVFWINRHCWKDAAEEFSGCVCETADRLVVENEGRECEVLGLCHEVCSAASSLASWIRVYFRNHSALIVREK